MRIRDRGSFSSMNNPSENSLEQGCSICIVKCIHRRLRMKTIITIVSAAVLVSALGFSADAATKRTSEMAQQQKSCKAHAAKKSVSYTHLTLPTILRV